VEYDDSWTMATDRDVWIMAHAIAVSMEHDIECALRASAPAALESVDPGLVPTAAGIFALLRKPIERVDIDPQGALFLRLGPHTVCARVDVDVVDWQWSVARTRSIPYLGFEVACFFRGEVRLGG